MIELGQVSSSGFEPGPGADRRLVRKIALVAVALCTLLLVTGSQRPARPGLQPLWSAPMAEGDGLTVGADTAYVNRNTAGRSRLSAYDVATGAVRWETSVDSTTAETRLAEPPGILLLTAERFAGGPDTSPVSFAQATVALDARTGRGLWSAPGQAMLVQNDTALLADHDSSGMMARLRLIRLADGGVVWARETPALYNVAVEGGKLITASADGRVDVLRLADGTRLTGTRVRWILPKPEDNQFDGLATAGDHLVVSRNWRDGGDVTVYRLDTLAEVWHADHGNGYAFPCGSGLCTCQGMFLTAYDMATGAVRWKATGVTNAWAAAADRVVADMGGDTGLVMLDPDTGHRIGEAVSGTTAWTIDPGGDLFLLNLTTSPPNRTSVTRWEVTTGRTRLLGTLELLNGYRCEVKGRYLACNRSHLLEVTAVR